MIGRKRLRGLLRKNKSILRSWDLLFLAFIITISFVPLLPLTGWQGYGPGGEYTYTAQSYFFRYNDSTFGNDKPKIFLRDQGNDISIIEVSDQGSFVDGRIIYSTFSTKTRLIDGLLTIHYDSKDLKFTKIVQPLDDGVQINYIFDKNTILEVSLWRWFFESIESFDRVVTRSLEPSEVIDFTIVERGTLYEGEIQFTTIPKNVTISGEGLGLNKITVLLEGKELSFSVRVTTSTSFNPINNLNLNDSRFLYPLIGIGASLVYLRLRISYDRKLLDDEG